MGSLDQIICTIVLFLFIFVYDHQFDDNCQKYVFIRLGFCKYVTQILSKQRSKAKLSDRNMCILYADVTGNRRKYTGSTALHLLRGGAGLG